MRNVNPQEIYALKDGSSGRKREQLLSKVLQPTSHAFFQKAGIRTGMNGLDLGCGGGDTTLQLAELVGSQGRVKGIDIDPVKMEIARQEAAQHGIDWVTYDQRDLRHWHESGNYDFIYARFLLVHLQDPKNILVKVHNSLKKDGIALMEEVDINRHYCHPYCYAFDRYVELYSKVLRRRGGNATLGASLPDLFRESGLEEVRAQLIQPIFLQGESKRIASLTLEHISDSVLQEGLATAAELDALMTELLLFEKRSHSLISLPGIYQVWGYRRQ